MLNDRKYMKNRGSKLDNLDPIRCVYYLIGANVLMFMLVPPPPYGYPINPHSNFSYLALYASGNIISIIYRLFTAMFLHASFQHLFFNMFGLYMFGRFVALRLGAKRFLKLFIVSGVAGNFLWLVSNMGSPVPLIGASGGVFGILVATALLEPNMRVMLLIPPIPLKMKTLVIVFGLLEVFFTLTGTSGNVANIAHIGGIIGGYIMVRYVFKMPVWDIFEYTFGKPIKGSKAKPFRAPKGWSVNSTRTRKTRPTSTSINIHDDMIQDTTVHVRQKEMDRILDKISIKGIQSLTPDELRMLKSARNKMKR